VIATAWEVRRYCVAAGLGRGTVSRLRDWVFWLCKRARIVLGRVVVDMILAPRIWL
jgi:hypothetical protein